MPQPGLRQSGATTVVMLIVLVVLLGLFYWVLVKPAHDRVDRIVEYLGTNVGPESSWSGLVGSIERDNSFHREQYMKIACSLWKLEHPGLPTSTPCPPGAPASRPHSPPYYP
jgi:hypothetical protein